MELRPNANMTSDRRGQHDVQNALGSCSADTLKICASTRGADVFTMLHVSVSESMSEEGDEGRGGEGGGIDLSHHMQEFHSSRVLSQHLHFYFQPELGE